MSKLRAGSIVKKGNYFYLVYKKKWLTLKTRSKDEAEKRAMELLPGLADPDIEWLDYLVTLGDAARIKLTKKSMPTDITWDNLYYAWSDKNKRLTQNPDTLRSYVGQLNALGRWAEDVAVSDPAAMTHALAAGYLATRPAVAQKRDSVLFARIYKVIGLSEAVWNGHDLDQAHPVRYRRISTEEMAGLLTAAGGKVDKALLRLSFTTGLRLSDCLRIDADSFDGDFAVVVPGKNKKSKPRPLTIPLLQGTRAALEGIAPQFFEGLRSDTTSNRMVAVFRAAGVDSNDFGNASFHSLRATFISMMDEAGISAHVTDAITGHASQGMHGRYSQPSKAALTAAVVKAIPDFA